MITRDLTDTTTTSYMPGFGMVVTGGGGGDGAEKVKVEEEGRGSPEPEAPCTYDVPVGWCNLENPLKPGVELFITVIP